MLYELDQHTNHRTHSAPNEPSDEKLMAGIQRGDEAALDMLYRRHLPLLRTVVIRVTNNDEDADEVLQESFLEIWRRAEHYTEGKGKALGWIVTLARRRAIDRVRRRQAYQRAQERLLEDSKDLQQPTMHHPADDDVIAADRVAILKRVLKTLPEPQRNALDMAFYRGMSQREIASRTGIPLGTIKTRLELAVRKVRTAILALGGIGEWHPSHS